MKTCIITGSNSGIGKAAAFQLAEQGCRVILACRNLAAAEDVASWIRDKTGNEEVHARRVDLSLLADTHAFIADLTREFGALDVLINNAADFDLSRKQSLITPEGNEAQFATNVLAPFLLSSLLLPLLQKSPDGRIINISSQGLMVYPNLKFDFDNIKAEKKYRSAAVYYQNKLALLMNTLTLRETLAGSAVSAHAIRVTNVKIDITRYPHISPVQQFMYRIKSRFSISPDQMAEVYTWLALGEKQAGFLFDEKKREVKANKFVYEQEPRKRLWELCKDLTQRA